MQLPVNRLQPGMILAEEVLAAEGGILLAAGASLRAEDIALLTRMQLATVGVAEASLALAGLDARFAGVQDDILLGIRELLRARFLRR